MRNQWKNRVILHFFSEELRNVCIFASNKAMEIKFDKEYLEELYNDGKAKNKKYRFQPQVVKKYQKRIDTLAAVTRIEELFTLNSLNFEALESSDHYSIRIDSQYRLEFQVNDSDSEPTITICLIMDITNHYQ